MPTNQPLDFPSLLREHGMRATEGRLALLQVLDKEHAPRSVAYLKKKVGASLDTVTVYRALEAFVAAHIARRVDLGHDHAHYELMSGRPHHHHAICTICGRVEDIEVTHAKAPEKDAIEYAKEFARIDSYALEFYGVCKRCG